jgi:hypothetical protein
MPSKAGNDSKVTRSGATPTHSGIPVGAGDRLRNQTDEAVEDDELLAALSWLIGLVREHNASRRIFVSSPLKEPRPVPEESSVQSGVGNLADDLRRDGEHSSKRWLSHRLRPSVGVD